MDPDVRLREAIEGFVTRVRQDLDVHGQSLSVTLAALLREAAPAAGPGAASPVADDPAQAVTRLLTAVRRLDAATSLGGILEALATGARGEVTRSGLLIRDNRALRGWGGYVFADGRTSETTIDADPLLVSAVDGRDVDIAADARSALLRPGPGHVARLLPLAVGGNVVAVLCAEGPGSGERAPAWSAPLEILVRHAAARLENVTSIRTVEALTKPASIWS